MSWRASSYPIAGATPSASASRHVASTGSCSITATSAGQPSQGPRHALRCSAERSKSWVVYKTHLTRTSGDDEGHLATQVETTSGVAQDVSTSGTIHAALADQGVLPSVHPKWPDMECVVKQTDAYCKPVTR